MKNKEIRRRVPPQKIKSHIKKYSGKKRKNRKKKRRYNLHHLNPRARVNELINQLKVKDPEIIKKIRQKKRVLINQHRAWNTLFDYSKPRFAWEAIKLIESWANVKNPAEININNIKDDQKVAWGALFGYNLLIQNATNIIKRDWSPAYPPINMMLKNELSTT